MASPLCAILVSIVILFQMIPSTISLSFTINVDENVLNEVCNTTILPSDCVNLLKSDPQTGTADVNGLCKIAIHKANATVYDNLGAILFLLNKTSDPVVKQRAQLCLNAYNLAIDEMTAANSALQSRDYNGVDVAVQGCMTHANECTSGFKPYPPFLPVENNKLYMICQAIVNIVGILKSGKL